jgi:hypothetical protein
MCEFIHSRLILSHHRNDEAARAVVDTIRDGGTGRIGHVAAMDDVVPDNRSKYALHLLETPAGEELWSVDQLTAYYQGLLPSSNWGHRSGPYEFHTGHSFMMVSVDSAIGLAAQGAASFQFDPMHAAYKSLIGLTASSAGAGVTIAVIDSGLDPHSGIAASTSSRGFNDRCTTTDIDDTNGHGTAVASIVHDVAPGAALQILKVGNGNPVSEWNLAAALLHPTDADVVNISLAFGLGYRDCLSCGRGQTHSSRSTVFERLIADVRRSNPDAIYVVAAGNRRQTLVDYPARFADMIAVGAVDSQQHVPTFSNTGATNHEGGNHDLLFFAPGGGNGEYVGHTTHGGGAITHHDGTSFAAPYVAAMVAVFLASQGTPRPDRDAVLDHLRQSAQKSIHGYTPAVHGNGVVHA